MVRMLDSNIAEGIRGEAHVITTECLAGVGAAVAAGGIGLYAYNVLKK